MSRQDAGGAKRRFWTFLGGGLMASAWLAACDTGSGAEFDWQLPSGVAEPVVPADNPMSAEKVELGRRLFWDPRLSADGSYACASCHFQERAFSDGRDTARGLHGDALPRNTLGLANVAYFSAYTWANPRLLSLEDQALVPLLVTRPPELGLSGEVDQVLARFEQAGDYAARFAAAFPGDAAPVSLANVVAALAAFERTLLSFGTAYDRYLAGEESALTAAERRGKGLFESERLGCASCHRGRLLSDAADPEQPATGTECFHNTGLYNLEGRGFYPQDNQGLYAFTLRPEDMGKFRTPSLRNVAKTAPYMHDGSMATLDDVLDHYAAGGRTIASGTRAGVGADNPYKDPRVHGFQLSAQERKDLLAFLESLTDAGFVSNPAFGNPFR